MIYLHIGQEKTGSTAIQSFLNYAEKRSKLIEKNIFYASFFHKPNSMPFVLYALGPAKNNLSKPFFKTNEEYLSFSAKIEDRLNRIASAASKESKIIFSSEHFHAQFRSEEKIRRLKSIINNFFPDQCITVILYIREQVSLAYSLHSESVKAGVSTAPKPPKPGENKYFDHVSDHSNTVQMWTQVFGKDQINIRIYEKSSLKNNDSIDDFCSLIDVSGEEILSKNNRNKLLDNKLTLRGRALRIKSIINKASNGEALPYNNLINEALAETFGDENSSKDPILCNLIRESYEESNEMLRRNSFMDRKSLFRPNKYDSDGNNLANSRDDIREKMFAKFIILFLQKLSRRNKNIIQKTSK